MTPGLEAFLISDRGGGNEYADTEKPEIPPLSGIRGASIAKTFSEN
jgi:hypothetical protein